jgi:hypothetical protein
MSVKLMVIVAIAAWAYVTILAGMTIRDQILIYRPFYAASDRFEAAVEQNDRAGRQAALDDECAILKRNLLVKANGCGQ